VFKYFYAIHEENSPSCLTQCIFDSDGVFITLDACPQSESFKDWNNWKSSGVKTVKTAGDAAVRNCILKWWP